MKQPEPKPPCCDNRADRPEPGIGQTMPFIEKKATETEEPCCAAQGGLKATPCDCDPGDSPSTGFSGILPSVDANISEDEQPCCGPPAGPAGSPYEKPGYTVRGFVEEFVETPSGPVPRIKTRLMLRDRIGTVKTRTGIGRGDYKVAPGLYAVGSPDPESPVLVTANYKLSFDALRCRLNSLNLWLLVLDTRGINVWCAAGKKTFSSEEVVKRVKQCRLDQIVDHKRLILPQLCATGVSAKQVKKGCGFRVIWGPIRAGDIKKFIENGMKADTPMRRVTFTFFQRLELVPVEVVLLAKPSRWALLAIFILSGIGLHVFSPGDAWTRGIIALSAYAGGVLAGMVLVPALLPWIPGRAFAVKGGITGVLAAVVVLGLMRASISGLEALALFLFTAAAASFFAMNFTGSTPYTSPTGVEKEMRRAIPFQAGALLIACVAWVSAAFLN